MSSQNPSSDTSSGLTLGEIAELVEGRLQGDASLRVRRVAPVLEARPDELGFLALRRYCRHAASSSAGAFLVAADLDESVPAGRARVVVEDAYGALVEVLARLHPEARPTPHVHPTAVVGAGVRLGRGVTLGPYAIVGEGAEVGDGSAVGAHAVVGGYARIGRDCTLHPHAVLYPGVRLGDRVVVHAGARLGSDGFGYTPGEGAHRKVPQVGGCVVGDDVEIGANSTVDRGSLGDTVLGDGVKLDNLVQVAHNVRVGARTLMAALVGVAGSTRIGEDVWLGGRVSAINHLEIGDRARLAFACTAMRDVRPGETVSGTPARPHRESLRKQAHLERLPGLLRRVAALEERLERLEAAGDRAPRHASD